MLDTAMREFFLKNKQVKFKYSELLNYLVVVTYYVKY